MTTVQNFIDGKLVDAVSGDTMPLVDPATGEKFGTAPVSTRKTSTTRMPLRRGHFRNGNAPPHRIGGQHRRHQTQPTSWSGCSVSLAEVPAHASVAVGGHRQGDRGYYVEPTVIGGLRQDDRLSQNEIFGPVITVQSFDDEDDVVRLANGVEYGLASSVWTKDVSVALRVSAALDFGCVWINTHIPIVAEVPHGGFKSSGHGKDLSMYGFEDYTRVKHVMAKID